MFSYRPSQYKKKELFGWTFDKKKKNFSFIRKFNRINILRELH